jgi:hypothetical protein
MESYICADIPHELYRMDYPGSRTTYTSEAGFKAADTNKTFESSNLHDFKQAVENQFRWSCRDPLPFISLFSDRKHAENWRHKKPWHGSPDQEGHWALYVINTTELRKTTSIFKLGSLIAVLNLDIPEGAQQHIQGAYLCLHRIPPAAIIQKRTPAQVEEGKCVDIDR